MSKHTERSLKLMRDRGYLCWMVERIIPSKPHIKRVDLFNIIDIIAIDMSSTVGVQACGPDFSEHKDKIMEGEYTEAWLENPHRELLLIGWRKLKLKRGVKAMRWRPRIGEFQLKYGKLIFHEWEQPRTDAEKE